MLLSTPTAFAIRLRLLWYSEENVTLFASYGGGLGAREVYGRMLRLPLWPRVRFGARSNLRY